jgi:fatty-acyl-CoA synthase
MPDPTLLHAIERTIRSGDPRAGYRFLDAAERPTWHDMATTWSRARRAAGALRAAGVGRGHTVALILPTAPSFLDAWLGCQVLGAVPVALYPPVRLGRLDEYFERSAAMLRVSEAAAIVTDARVRRLLGRLVELQPTPLGVLDAAALLDGAPVEPEPAGADDVQMIQFSSGTTVDPKPVVLTHGQTMANARAISDQVRATNPLDSATPAAGVSWLPLYHDMGLIGCVFPAALTPGPLTLIPPEVFLAKPAVWLRAISRYRGTISPAPSFAYALCTERIRPAELEGVDLSSWSMALNGAEPVAPAATRAFIERFAPYGLRAEALMPVYGLSEMALAVTFTPPGRGMRTVHLDRAALGEGRAVEAPPGDGAVELATLGPPLPGYAVEIRSGAGSDVGRVWCAGPSRMKGYLGRAGQPFDGPWLDTGDVGLLHDGELVVTGRAKDLLVIRGRNHAPQDLERAVDTVDGVRTGCAAAVADIGDHGERLLLFVEVRAPVEGQAEACATAVRAATGVTPDLVLLLAPGTLPRTSSGKIRRSETLARFHAGTLTEPDAVTPWMVAGALARSALGWLRAGWRARG